MGRYNELMNMKDSAQCLEHRIAVIVFIPDKLFHFSHQPLEASEIEKSCVFCVLLAMRSDNSPFKNNAALENFRQPMEVIFRVSFLATRLFFQIKSTTDPPTYQRACSDCIHIHLSYKFIFVWYSINHKEQWRVLIEPTFENADLPRPPAAFPQPAHPIYLEFSVCQPCLDPHR